MFEQDCKAQKVTVNIIGFAACVMPRVFITSARLYSNTLPAGVMVLIVDYFVCLGGDVLLRLLPILGVHIPGTTVGINSLLLC